MKNLFIYLFFFINITNAQLSTKHWLPPLWTQDNNTNYNQYLYLSTPEITPFTVKITNGEGIEINGSPFTISNTNPKTIFLGNENPSIVFDTYLNAFSNDSGLILEASREFYVSLRLNSNDNSEVIVSKGIDALGTHFKIGSLPQTRVSDKGSFFMSVMAKENGTIINLTDYDPNIIFMTIVGPISPNSQTILLNEGYSVMFSGFANNIPNLDGFVGATLKSNKPVSVISGNFLGNMGSANVGHDINLDQIVPVDKIGNEYILIKGNGSNISERPLTIATEDNTQIFINGSTSPIYTLNEGEFVLIPSNYYQGMENENMYVSSNKPVYMYQILAGNSSDASTGFSFIPPLSCFYKKKIDLIPNINKIGDSTYSTDILAITYINSIVTINGLPISSLPETVEGNPNWVTYKIPGYTGNVTIESTGPIAVGILGNDNDKSGFSSYYSGFGNEPKNTSTIICSEGLTNLLVKIDGNPESGGIWTPALNSGTDFFNPSFDLPGTYNYYHINNCDIVDVNVTVTIQEAPFAGNDTSIIVCEKDEVIDLTTVLGNNIEPNGYWEPELNSGTNFYSPEIDGSGMFTYFIEDNFICQSSASVTIISQPVPEISDINEFSVCDNNSDGDEYNGYVNFDLLLLNDQIINDQQNISISYHESKLEALNNLNALSNYYSDTKEIYVKVTNTLTGCSTIKKIKLIVNSLPEINSTVDLYQCDIEGEGSSIFNLNESEILISNEQNLNYYYFNSYLDALSNNSPIFNTENFIASNGDLIWVKIVNNLGCFKIMGINLIVSNTQVSSNYIYNIVECDAYIDENNTEDDGIFVFNFTNAINEIRNQFMNNENLLISLYENEQDALSETNQIAELENYINTNSPFNQTIWVRIESSINNNCVGLGPFINLTVNSAPTINLGEDITLCTNTSIVDNIQEIILNATPLETGDYNYIWTPTNPDLDSNGNQSSFYTTTNQGNYKVKVINNLTNCIQEDEITINYSSAPESAYIELLTPIFSSGKSAIKIITFGGSGEFEYSINGGLEWQNSPFFYSLNNGIYSALVRDIYNCGIIETEKIQTINYLSYFTPNGDGYNDTWNISNLPTSFKHKIYIFDRYGKLITEIKPNSFGWDGTFNNQDLPASDYWFKIEFTQDNVRKEFKSHFSLVR